MSADIKLSKVKLTGEASVFHRPGAVRLDSFPLLSCSLKQWGEGVRTEDNGTSVAEIYRASVETPDFAELAKRFGTTAPHVIQAIQYAFQAGFDKGE